MPTFARITGPSDLPRLGDRETTTLDFKTELKPRKGKRGPDLFEAAKDVAALASVYGGVLLIGAIEDTATGQLVSWKRMPLGKAQRTVRAYEEAVRDRCRPVPLIDPSTIEHPEGNFVVAINVFPVLHQPVAVKVRGSVSDGYGSDTYIFPVRLSTHAIFLQPDQIAMLMNPDIRRTLILLEHISEKERDAVAVHWTGFRRTTTENAPVSVSLFSISKVDVDSNVVVLAEPRAAKLVAGYQSQTFAGTVPIPLDDIESVWCEAHELWAIRVRGHFDNNKTPPRYSTRVEG
jgi:hypothetical protein